MKIFNLIYNELVKQFKKPSTNIIVVLILISAIVLPIVVQKIEPNDNYKNREESVKYMIQDMENAINELANDKSQKAAIQRKYYEIEKEYQQLTLDNKISFDDWREIELQAIRDASYKLAAIQFVLDGYSKDVVLEKLQSEEPTKVSKYYELELAKKKEIEASYIAEINELKDVITTSNYKRHTELEIARTNAIINSYKNDIAEYEKLLAKNPQDTEGKAKLGELKRLKEAADKRIPQYEQKLAVLQFRYDNDINYDNKNWKNNSILEIEEELKNLNMEIMDEKSFNMSLSSESLVNTYEEYIEAYKKANEIRVERIKELWYGLENDIADLGAIKDARSTIDTTYEIYVILAVVVAIILGGGIVASEYSNGSIRLLMIRPVSRWKILLAKLLAVLLVSFAIVALGVSILVISSSVVFGADTLKTPVLQTINGNIVEIDYIKYMLPQLILSTSSVLFITSIVFMLSTLARNTALAVALGMLLYIGIAPVVQMLIASKQVWIINTMLPYINGSYFKLMPTVSQALKESGMSLNYALGAQQLVIISIVFLAITFIVFSKKDIKN